MGLNVGPVATKYLFTAASSQFFCLINEFASPIVPFAGQTLGILIGEDRSGGFKHSLRNKILGGDEFSPIILATDLIPDNGVQFWSLRCQRRRTFKHIQTSQIERAKWS